MDAFVKPEPLTFPSNRSPGQDIGEAAAGAPEERAAGAAAPTQDAHPAASTAASPDAQGGPPHP